MAMSAGRAGDSQSESVVVGLRRADRAERVLAGLRRFARREIVCEPTGTIAQAIGESTDTVRRGISDLIAGGLLEPTGLSTGKARQYRLLDVASPQPSDGSPQLT